MSVEVAEKPKIVGGERVSKGFVHFEHIILRLDDDTTVRLPMDTILQMMNEFEFTVQKKRVHSYLINPDPYLLREEQPDKD